jgi:hypothetical protein
MRNVALFFIKIITNVFRKGNNSVDDGFTMYSNFSHKLCLTIIYL